ncbi:TPA: hypothetical protein ACX14I_003709 [Klebsiella pneumoniae]
MTSKFSIDNRELLQRISSGEAVVGIDFGNLIVRELAAFRLAAMDSEPVAYISKSDFDAGYPHILARRDFNKACTMPVYAAQPAPVVEREPIAWLNDAYLARGVVDGEAGSEDAGPGYIPVYREAGPQSAPVVPEEITIETATIIAYGLPTTNIGAIFKAGHDACRAAMLQELKKSAGTEAICRSDENVQVLHTKSPAQSDCCPAQNVVVPAQSPIDHGYLPECECSGCKATARICAELSANSSENPDCWCRTCRPVVLNDMRFVVCPDCGNKRCPRANDHRNACTGSNEPGQEGSAYPDTLQEPKP